MSPRSKTRSRRDSQSPATPRPTTPTATPPIPRPWPVGPLTQRRGIRRRPARAAARPSNPPDRPSTVGGMLRVTIDSNVLGRDLARIREASDGFAVEIAPTTVTLREHGDPPFLVDDDPEAAQ